MTLLYITLNDIDYYNNTICEFRHMCVYSILVYQHNVLNDERSTARHLPCFQVYVLSEQDACVPPRREAFRRGVGALLVTVDANAPRHGALHRATAGATGVFPSPSFTWEQLEERRDR